MEIGEDYVYTLRGYSRLCGDAGRGVVKKAAVIR